MRSFFLACLIWFTLAAPGAQAHEVRPAIGDLTTGGGTLTIVLRMSVEPVLAGVNLEGLADTNDTESAEDVDIFRAMPQAELYAEVEAQAARILKPIVAETPQGIVPLTLWDVDGEAEPNFDLPRETRLTLTGPLPPGAETVTVTWPAAYGVLVLRQIDTEEGYTGYLIGGTSEPIAVAQGTAQGMAGALLTGAHHVVSDPAHILLALSLVLLTLKLAPLGAQLAAIVLGHAGGLGLMMLGVQALPVSTVELLTGALVIYVAGEAFFSDRLRTGRLTVLGAFAAMHALAFGNAIGGGWPTTAAFSLGVDLAQIVLAGLAAAALYALCRLVASGDAAVYHARIIKPLAAVFTLTGAGLVVMALIG